MSFEDGSWNDFANYVRLRATSWNHAQELLLEQARITDPNCSIELEVKSIRKVKTTHSCPVDGFKYLWFPKNEEDERQNEKAIYPAATGSIKGTFKGRDFQDCFSSWLRETILGFNTGTGGASGKNKFGFSYEVTLYIQDFPIIYDRYLKFEELKKENSLYFEKKKKLIEEYSEYHHFKCYSDPIHASYTMELNELEGRIRNLKNLIAARRNELDDERDARTNINMNFDINLYNNLSKEFSK